MSGPPFLSLLFRLSPIIRSERLTNERTNGQTSKQAGRGSLVLACLRSRTRSGTGRSAVRPIKLARLGREKSAFRALFLWIPFRIAAIVAQTVFRSVYETHTCTHTHIKMAFLLAFLISQTNWLESAGEFWGRIGDRGVN